MHVGVWALAQLRCQVLVAEVPRLAHHHPPLLDASPAAAASSLRSASVFSSLSSEIKPYFSLVYKSSSRRKKPSSLGCSQKRASSVCVSLLDVLHHPAYLLRSGQSLLQRVLQPDRGLPQRLERRFQLRHRRGILRACMQRNPSVSKLSTPHACCYKNASLRRPSRCGEEGFHPQRDIYTANEKKMQHPAWLSLGRPVCLPRRHPDGVGCGRARVDLALRDRQWLLNDGQIQNPSAQS
jgi:hypothetical protein